MAETLRTATSEDVTDFVAPITASASASSSSTVASKSARASPPAEGEASLDTSSGRPGAEDAMDLEQIAIPPSSPEYEPDHMDDDEPAEISSFVLGREKVELGSLGDSRRSWLNWHLCRCLIVFEVKVWKFLRRRSNR